MAFDTAVKERLELIFGVRGGRIQPLKRGATTDEIVEKVNEILKLLQP